MKTLETTVTVERDGTLKARLPWPLAPGPHRAVVTIDEAPLAPAGESREPFPVDDCGPWPAGFTLRRHDLYGDDGR